MSTESNVIDLLHLGLGLAQLGRSVASGELPDPIEVVRSLSSIAVALAPVEDLKKYLDDAARRRAHVVAELGPGQADYKATIGSRSSPSRRARASPTR